MNTLGLVSVVAVVALTLLHYILNWKTYRSNYKITAVCLVIVKAIPQALCVVLPQGMILLVPGVLGILTSMVAWGVLAGYEEKSIKHSSREISYLFPLFKQKQFQDSSQARYWLLVGIDIAVLAVVAFWPALVTTPI